MATNGASGAWRRRSRQNSSISPMTSTPACCAASTVQCGAGWVSGAPGVSTKAAKPAHDTLRKSAVVKPACAALAMLSALSSPAITSAPPAFRAWQLASPDPPRPNTATVLPAKEVTGIMIEPCSWLFCYLHPCAGGRRCAAAAAGGRQQAQVRNNTPLPDPPPQGGKEQKEPGTFRN